MNTVSGQVAETPIEISTRGPVGSRARERLRGELADLASESPRQQLFLRGDLCVQRNRSIRRPVTASGTMLLRGRRVHARASGAGRWRRPISSSTGCAAASVTSTTAMSRTA